MKNEKKPQSRVLDPTARKPKPFAVQVVDALIDGAAAIAKSMVVEPFSRISELDKKAVPGKAAETEQVAEHKARTEETFARKNAVVAKVGKKKANARRTKNTGLRRTRAKIDTKRLATTATKKALRKTAGRKPR